MQHPSSKFPALTALAFVIGLGAGCTPQPDPLVTSDVAANVKIDPWVHPQPDTPLCPICPVRRGKISESATTCTNAFAGTLSSTYPDYPVTSLTLKLYDAAGGLVHTESGIAPSVGYANDPVDHEFESLCAYETAVLTWAIAGSTGSQSLTIIDED